MSDLLVIFCVAVLPWILWGLLRLIKRGYPTEEPDAGDDVKKAASDNLLGSIVSWFWGK